MIAAVRCTVDFPTSYNVMDGLRIPLVYQIVSERHDIANTLDDERQILQDQHRSDLARIDLRH